MHIASPDYAGHVELTPEDAISQPEPRDLVRDVQIKLAEAFSFDRVNREDAVTDLKFLAGDQWPEYARAQRVNRPMLTINKLPQFLHQVTNDIRKNAPVLKVTPVGGQQDPMMADIYNGVISDIQYRSSARHVYATAAYHAAACGIGHFRVITRYQDDDSFDQEVGIELIPYPLAVYWDPAAVKPDRSDAMWCIVVDLVPRATFKEKYPDKLQVSVNEQRANNFTSGLFWSTNDYILVAEYWCKVPCEKTIFGFQNGETYDVTGLNMQSLAMLQQQHGPVVRQRKAQGYDVQQSLVTGAEVLSGPNKWPGKHIPIIAVIGDEVPLDRLTVRHGLVRHMRDPQQLYNFYRSAAAEHIALSPKSPWLVTDTMISQHKADWDTANTRNKPYLRFKPDDKVPGGPQRIHAPEPPSALWQEQQVATQDLKDVSGIHDASLGAKSNETSGKAILARESQGDTANFHYMDNLTRSLEQTGRILIDLIPKIYDNQRVVRLQGEDGVEKFAPINHVLYAEDGVPVMINDLSVGRYDIRVVTGPNYATRRLEAMDAMMQLMQTLGPEAAPVLADLIVKNADWPDAAEATKRLRNLVPDKALRDPNQPPSNPLEDPMAKAELAIKFAGARKTMAEADKIGLDTLALYGMISPPIPPPLPPDVEPQPPQGPPPGMPHPMPQMPPQQMGGQGEPDMDQQGGPPDGDMDNQQFPGGPQPPQF